MKKIDTATNEVTINLDDDRKANAAPETHADIDADRDPQDVVINVDSDAGDGLPEEATVNDDGSITLRLKYPRTIKILKNGITTEQVYTSLTFNRLTGADLNAIRAASEASASYVGFSRSTRVPAVIMRNLFDIMDGYDIAHGGEVIGYFLPNGRKTGRKS
jgi:hypothetical protein